MEPMTESAIIRALFLEGADLDLDHPHGLAMAYDIAARIQAKAVSVHDHATGNDAMRAVCDEPPFSEEPFAGDIRRTIEVRRCQPEDIASPELDAALDEMEAEAAARQIDRAHPAVLDMATFAADSLGLGKGA